MGCDIHLYVEAKLKKSFLEKIQFWKPKKWLNIDKWSKNKYFIEDEYEPEFVIKPEDSFYTGRNYNLFCALCGVRSFAFDGEPSRISDPKGLPVDVSDVVKSESEKYGVDGHSHNWSTLSELINFDWSDYGDTCDEFINETIPKLKAKGFSPDNIRIVYFFDN